MTAKTRVIALLISVLFVLGLAACGGDDGVSPVNEGPTVGTGIPDLAAKAGDTGVDDYIDLDDAFSGSIVNGKRMTYRIVENTDESLVSVAIDLGNRLDLTFHKDRCCATITVEAKDGENKTATETFEVCLYQNPRLPGVACWEAGNIYTVVGTGFPAKGEDGLLPEETGLYWPQDINFSPDGTPYVIDWNNHRVISMDPDTRTMKTIIGGRFGDGEDGVATEIGLNHPTHVSFDPQGYLILTAWHNSFLKRMDLATGYIETFCGTGARSFNGDGIPAETAFLDLPASTAFDSNGRLHLGDQANQRIRMIDDQGLIQTVAGNGTPGFGGDGGPATSANLFFEVGQAANPSGKIIFDADDNLYITDTRNHCIRMVNTSGIITTVAGIGTQRGFSGDGGPATSAMLNEPRDITMDASGNLYIADTRNFCIRMVDTGGIITTVAGMPGQYGYSGDGGPPTSAKMSEPYGVEIGPDGNLWITDTQNSAVRVIY